MQLQDLKAQVALVIIHGAWESKSSFPHQFASDLRLYGRAKGVEHPPKP